MAYRRRYYGSFNNNYKNQKVNVLIQWDTITNAAYTVRFDRIGKHFDKCMVIINLIKMSIPSSDREYTGKDGIPPKTWYISEKYIRSIREACEAIPDFEVTFVEKPEQVFTAQFHSKESDYEEFKRLLSMAHIPWTDTTELNVAIKSYRKAAMYLHPDRNPNMSAEMSKLNEIWTRLKGTYFKDSQVTQ